MRRALTALAVLVLLAGKSAFAHRIDEYLQATVLSLQEGRIEASMRLVPGILVAPSVIAGIDSNGDGVLSADEERSYAQRVLGDLAIAVNDRRIEPKLLSWSFPSLAAMRGGLGEIRIEYAVDLPSNGVVERLVLTNRHLNGTSVYLMNTVLPESGTFSILGQKRNEQQSTYELDFEQLEATAPHRTERWEEFRTWFMGVQFSSLFHLGMRHIAEGTDHLLFLLALLLPAPLIASGRKWGGPAGPRSSLFHILSIVTAFTIGHSLTLTLAALDVVHVPSRPVEVLVAVSIVVSALHALRPLVPGKESWIAIFFGLIHGLAFAATLDRLGLGRWDRLAGILAFNLGIETMQLIVVAAILPSLVLLSRTEGYSVLRIGGAVFAGTAAIAWTLERVLGVQTPADVIVNSLARHAVSIAVILFVVSAAAALLRAFPHNGAHRPGKPETAATDALSELP